MHKIVLLVCKITRLLIVSLFVKVFGVLALHSMCISKIDQLPGSLEECVFCIFIPKVKVSCGTWKYFPVPQSCLVPHLHFTPCWYHTWTYTTSVLPVLVAVQKRFGQAGGINFCAWNTYPFLNCYILPHHPQLAAIPLFIIFLWKLLVWLFPAVCLVLCWIFPFR